MTDSSSQLTLQQRALLILVVLALVLSVVWQLPEILDAMNALLEGSA